MGLQALNWVYSTPLVGSKRSVLREMAAPTKDGENICFLSVGTLAYRVRLTTRQVRRIQRDLEHAGYIERVGWREPQRVTEWQLLLDVTPDVRRGTDIAVSGGE
jgi:hypothetical protein